MTEAKSGFPRWIVDRPLSSRAIHVYMVLLVLADERMIVTASRRIIAERARCSDDTITRAIVELAREGVIERMAVGWYPTYRVIIVESAALNHPRPLTEVLAGFDD